MQCHLHSLFLRSCGGDSAIAPSTESLIFETFSAGSPAPLLRPATPLNLVAPTFLSLRCRGFCLHSSLTLHNSSLRTALSPGRYLYFVRLKNNKNCVRLSLARQTISLVPVSDQQPGLAVSMQMTDHSSGHLSVHTDPTYPEGHPEGKELQFYRVDNSGSHFQSQKFGGCGSRPCVLSVFVLYLVIVCL